jgi:hypothetical protein
MSWNESYDWTGPSHWIALHIFRVDSPMKGRYSEPDETKLSFHVITTDTETMTMTIREWLSWGDSRAVVRAINPQLTPSIRCRNAGPVP